MTDHNHHQQIVFIYSTQTTVWDNVPPNVTRACVDIGVDEIRAKTFQDCHELMEVNLNEGLQVVGEEAFRYCRSLRTISIPCSVWRIGGSAFLGCGLLVEVDLSEGLLEIGEGAFLSCRSLQRVSIPSTVEIIGKCAFSYCQSLTDVSLQNGLNAIESSAFEYCIALTSISIPSTVEIIDHNAFSYCQSLAEVSLQNGIQVIGTQAFSYCVALVRIQVPSSVHRIENGAFLNCTKLVDVELSQGLRSIGESAFMGCSSLCAVSIPCTTNSIANRAFQNCKSLLGVQLSPSSKVDLGCAAFGDCAALVNISIPVTVEEVPPDLFRFCPLLHRKVQERYTNLPIHEACYQVSSTTANALEALLSNSINDEGSLTDAFGMTPLHILATSDNRRTDLLEVLLDHYPFEIVSQKDVFGKTMLDHLIVHTSSRSIRMMQMVLQSTMRNILSGWGLESWTAQMSLQIETFIHWNEDSTVRHQQVRRVLANLVPLMQVEVTSILELVLWKIQIRAYSDCATSALDREFCRATCKADVVIANVAGFLWNEESSLTQPLGADVLPQSYHMISMEDL